MNPCLAKTLPSCRPWTALLMAVGCLVNALVAAAGGESHPGLRVLSGTALEIPTRAGATHKMPRSGNAGATWTSVGQAFVVGGGTYRRFGQTEYLGAHGVALPTNGAGAGLAISGDGETVLGNGPAGGPFTSLPTPEGWLARFSGGETLPSPNRIVPCRRAGVVLEFPAATSSRYELQESSDLVRWTARKPEIVGNGELGTKGFLPAESSGRFLRLRRLY